MLNLEFKDLINLTFGFLGYKLIPKGMLQGWGLCMFYSVPYCLEVFLRLAGVVTYCCSYSFHDQFIISWKLYWGGKTLTAFKCSAYAYHFLQLFGLWDPCSFTQNKANKHMQFHISEVTKRCYCVLATRRPYVYHQQFLWKLEVFHYGNCGLRGQGLGSRQALLPAQWNSGQNHQLAPRGSGHIC